MSPSVYMTGLSMGLGLIVAIGAQNAFVLRQGLKREHVLPVVLACALSDALLIALGLTNWSWTCRIARSSTLSLKSQGYVQAAQTLGYGDLRIMFTQILPNMMGPILVMATLGMGSAVLSEAALSFLGLGIQPPFPSWGSMLTDARQLIQLAPWVAIFPGLAIFLSVLGFNLLGDGLRDSLDPHMRTRKP